MFDFLFKDKRRKELRAKPLSDDERATITRNVPYLAQLTDTDRHELEGHMQVFLAEKSFEGCGGLEVTDEMKLTIAAQACILLLHRETEYFPDLQSILVYPHAYRAKTHTHVGGGVVIENDQERLGESWVKGAVVLAWDDVKRGASNIHDGHNLVLHEFAHQLDAEDGSMDGAPDLGRRSLYSAWAHVLGEEYADLTALIDEHRKSDIDAYGGTNPAEFFAVVTESFFEKGSALKRKHPDLYERLREFYKQDPAALEEAAAAKARAK